MLKKLSAVPYVVWMAIFVIIPLGFMIYFAFTTSDGEFTFDNIVSISKYTYIFVKSINMAIVATAISLVLAFPISYMLSRMDESKQNICVMLIMLPMWMSFLLRTYGWMTLIENEGLINGILGFFGIAPLAMINTSGAVVLGMVYNYLPFMILPIYSIMARIDESIIEAAQDLGCNTAKVMRKVIIPMSIPGIITGITMVFVPSVSTFIISRMLGGGQNMMIGDLIEQQFIGTTYDPNSGSAMSLVLMIVMLLVMGIMSSMDDDEVGGLVI